MTLYMVIAYRWGQLNGHQYLVYCGVDRDRAGSRARAEQVERGGKYGCAVYQLDENGANPKLVEYFGASMHNETAPFHNAQIDYLNRLGYLLQCYVRGAAYRAMPENEEFMELIEVDKPPQCILEEVSRQARLRDLSHNSTNAPAASSGLCPLDPSPGTLLPCPFCGSTDLILRTYPAQADVAAFTTHIVCNAGGSENWHRCGASQSITRETYTESRAAGIKAWNIRFSPQEYCDGQAG